MYIFVPYYASFHTTVTFLRVKQMLRRLCCTSPSPVSQQNTIMGTSCPFYDASSTIDTITQHKVRLASTESTAK